MTDALDGWLFEPRSASTMVVVRIAFGLVLVGWALSIAFDVGTFFTDDGLIPTTPQRAYRFTLLEVFTSDAAAYVAWVALLASGVALVLGAWTRVAAVVAFLAFHSLVRRNPYIVNSGDILLRHLAFYLMFVPAGVAVSFDRWRRDHEGFWDPPARPQWPLRLVQIELSVGYLLAVWEKVRGGDAWNDGVAVAYGLRVGDIVRFPAPEFATSSLLFVNLATYGTLALELALGVLVWNRRLRPWVLGAGVVMHLLIDLTIEVGFFSYAIFVAYLAFIPPETMDRVLTRVRGRIGTRLGARAPA